jgi:hypothetical protein
MVVRDLPGAPGLFAPAVLLTPCQRQPWNVGVEPRSQAGDQLHEIAAGGLAWGARGTPHAFANRAKDPLLIMIM